MVMTKKLQIVITIRTVITMIMMPTVTRMMMTMTMMMMMMMMTMMMVIMMMKKIKIKIKLYWLTQLLVSPLSLHCGSNLQIIPILKCKKMS